MPILMTTGNEILDKVQNQYEDITVQVYIPIDIVGIYIYTPKAKTRSEGSLLFPGKK